MDIEIEHGTCARTAPRRHNGYFAGDFSQTRPMSSAELDDLLRDLTAVRRTPWIEPR